MSILIFLALVTMVKVFVYGTLKPGESNYQRYCGDRVITNIPAIIPGKLFALPFGYPALLWEIGGNLAKVDIGQDVPDTQYSQQQDQNYWVQGYLLTFANSQSLVKLDALESYRPDRPPTANEYQRLEMEVFSRDFSSLGTAWVYVMSRERITRSRGIFLPQGVWSSCLAKG